MNTKNPNEKNKLRHTARKDGTPPLAKTDIVRALREQGGFKVVEANKAYEIISKEFKNSLLSGRNVRLNGIGTLNYNIVKERVFVNPETGKKSKLLEHPRVSITTNPLFKKELKNAYFEKKGIDPNDTDVVSDDESD